MCGMAALYSLSLIPLEYVYVAVSSAEVKMQDGRKARRKEKRRREGRGGEKKKKIQN